MNTTIRIFVSDTHQTYADALAAFLKESFHVIGCTNRVMELSTLLDPLNLPDLVIMSCSATDPDSINNIRELKTRYPAVHVLATVVFLHNLPQKALTAAGASGWIVKTLIDPGDIIPLIQTIFLSGMNDL